MGPYIAIYSVAVLLLFLAEKIKKNQRIIIECIAIFLVCIMAGIRKRGVGTDTVIYFGPLMDAARYSSTFNEYMNSSWVSEWVVRITSEYEIGFTLLIYIIIKLFNSDVVVQFIVQLLIVVPVYIVLKRRKQVSLWFGMLVYLLLFNNLSLNAIRQSIAMSISLLAWQFWAEERKRKSIVCIATACFFHTSAFIGLGSICIYEFVQREWKYSLRLGSIRIDAHYVSMLFVVLAGLMVLTMSNSIARLSSGTIFQGITGYISGDVAFMPNQFIKMLPPLVLLLSNFKDIETHTGEARFFVCMIMLSIIFLQFTSVNSFSGRIAEYFMYYGIVSYPIACGIKKKSGIMCSMMIGYLLFYWFFYYGFGNAAETVPFVSVFSKLMLVK